MRYYALLFLVILAGACSMSRDPRPGEEPTYGKSCGYGAETPEMRIRMNRLVETRDTTELNEWLGSKEPTSICYAVEGLRKLQANGISLSIDQQERLEELEDSKHLVRTCSGCFFELRPMNEALVDPLLRDQ
jgi:hypothetical protein